MAEVNPTPARALAIGFGGLLMAHSVREGADVCSTDKCLPWMSKQSAQNIGRADISPNILRITTYVLSSLSAELMQESQRMSNFGVILVEQASI